MGHVIVVDLGYGDCGKGTVVDHLCATRDVHTVVRFNGGAQAAHTVVLGDGRKHTFAQFGSGTFRPGVRTHLSRFMVVDPLALVAEADHLVGLGVHDVWDRLTVDRAALLSTPYHREANRALEIARGSGRHGSCGMGVGAAMSYALSHVDDAPRVEDCLTPSVLRAKLSRLRAFLGVDGPPVDACVAAFAAFAETASIVDGLRIEGPCVFEGAQGVLLDEWHGFHPYTTWSTTTFANAEALLGGEPAYRLGVLRTFTTRHGPGPLVTEDPALPITDVHNPTNPWQGAFRVGHFDAVAHRYALDVCGGVDGLALTHLDTAASNPALRMCVDYDGTVPTRGVTGDLDRQERLTRALLASRPRLVPVSSVSPVSPASSVSSASSVPPASSGSAWSAAISEELATPVVLESWGPRSEDKTSTDSAPSAAAQLTC